MDKTAFMFPRQGAQYVGMGKDFYDRIPLKRVGTPGYQVPDEECDLNYCKEAYQEEFEYAMSSSLGFGGHNASILVKMYHG